MGDGLKKAREDFNKENPRSKGSAGRESAEKSRVDKFYTSTQGEPWNDLYKAFNKVKRGEAEDSVRKRMGGSSGSAGRESAYKQRERRRNIDKGNLMLEKMNIMFGPKG